MKQRNSTNQRTSQCLSGVSDFWRACVPCAPPTILVLEHPAVTKSSLNRTRVEVNLSFLSAAFEHTYHFGFEETEVRLQTSEQRVLRNSLLRDAPEKHLSLSVSMFFSRRSACTSSIVRHLQYRTSATHATRRKPRDVQQTPTDYTMKILAEANQGHFKNALHYATKMKTSGVVPSVTIYNALMSLAAREQSWLFAWAMLDDMLHTGVEPTATTFAHLIQVLCLDSFHLLSPF